MWFNFYFSIIILCVCVCLGIIMNDNEVKQRKNKIKPKTRRLKSFPWDALVYGSIMAFYLGLIMEQNKTKHPLALSRVEPRVTKFDKVPMF